MINKKIICPDKEVFLFENKMKNISQYYKFRSLLYIFDNIVRNLDKEDYIHRSCDELNHKINFTNNEKFIKYTIKFPIKENNLILDYNLFFFNFSQDLNQFGLILDTDVLSFFIFEKCPLCNIYKFIDNDELCDLCDKKIKENTVENEYLYGYVYVVSDGSSLHKIGYSRNFPDKRVTNLATSYHKEFKILGFFRSTGAHSHEKKLHKMFSSFRRKGEWFEISYEEIKKQSKMPFIDMNI